MRTNPYRVVGSLATLLLILSPILTTAQPPSAPRTVPDDAFVAVSVPGWASVQSPSPTPTARAVVVLPVPTVSTDRRPSIPPVPTPRLVVVERPPEPSGHRASGTASWYCGNGSPCTRGYPGGLYAAAGPALRVGDWRGRVVTVSALGRSVAVRLVDWCACPGRVIDLYSDAFQRLAPLSRGVLKVSVTWN